MRLKNVLIVVNDLQRAVRFYKQLFGLQVVLEQDGNVILTEGLTLQDRAVWEEFLQRKAIPKNHCSELYFEEPDLETFVRKLENYQEPIQYVTRLTEHAKGRKAVRFYDPDGNLIEVATPMTDRLIRTNTLGK